MGMNSFAPFLKRYPRFVVKNITTDHNKIIKIFNYPILWDTTRDLLAIKGVAEADIRSSLLKGEIRHKLLAGDITIVYSDIDLLQFNDDERLFLHNSGINIGLQITASNMAVSRLEDVVLVGIINNINTVFTIPSGKFLQNSTYKIIVYKNGVKQVFLDDYFIAESAGPGTGYDTVIVTSPPTITPLPVDILTADYYKDNT